RREGSRARNCRMAIIGDPSKGVWIKASSDNPGLFYLREARRDTQRRIPIRPDGSSGYHSADVLREIARQRGYSIVWDDSFSLKRSSPPRLSSRRPSHVRSGEPD